MKYRLFIALLFLNLTVLGQAFNPWLLPSEEDEIKPRYIRSVLNMFTVGAASGYSNTLFRQDLSGFAIFSSPEGLFLVNRDEGINPEQFTGIANWLTNPQLVRNLTFRSPYDVPANPINNPVDNPDLLSRGTLISGDTTALIFRDGVSGMPFTFYVNFHYQRLIRVGVGATFEWQAAAKLKSRDYADILSTYTADYQTTLNRKYFITAGYKFHDWWEYSFVADVQFGRFRMGNAFNQGLSAYSTYLNIGLPIEKNISEYFRFVLRPSFDIKSMGMTLPENNGVLPTTLYSFNLTLGIELNYPKYPKCFIESCRTQKEHNHFNKKYRGQKIFKKQNPRIGEIYKSPKSSRESTIKRVSGNISRIFEKKPRAYSSNLFKLQL